MKKTEGEFAFHRCFYPVSGFTEKMAGGEIRGNRCEVCRTVLCCVVSLSLSAHPQTLTDTHINSQRETGRER